MTHNLKRGDLVFTKGGPALYLRSTSRGPGYSYMWVLHDGRERRCMTWWDGSDWVVSMPHD